MVSSSQPRNGWYIPAAKGAQGGGTVTSYRSFTCCTEYMKGDLIQLPRSCSKRPNHPGPGFTTLNRRIEHKHLHTQEFDPPPWLLSNMIAEYNGGTANGQLYLAPADVNGGMYDGTSSESSAGSPLNSTVRLEEGLAPGAGPLTPFTGL